MTSNQLFQDDLLNSIVNPNWKNETFEKEKHKAFKEGYKKGFDAKEMAVKNFFYSNVDKATSVAEKLFKEFNTINFKCKSLLLKPRDLRSFELLFIVDEHIYLSDARKQVYKLIRAYKKENNTNEFQFECHVMPESGEVNMSLILSEGFSLKYEPKSR
jgi:hypothetical protein